MAYEVVLDLSLGVTLSEFVERIIEVEVTGSKTAPDFVD